jgi:hypothetical protein
MKTLELEVYRKWLLPDYTIGKFLYRYSDEKTNNILCDTLEDPIRELVDKNNDGDFNDPGEGKVYGDTAIPCGRYEVELWFWKKYGKEYPRLKGVKGFSGILIHSVVDKEDTLGCIGVGLNKIKGQLVDGRLYSTIITEMVRKAKLNYRVFITIKQ